MALSSFLNSSFFEYCGKTLRYSHYDFPGFLLRGFSAFEMRPKLGSYNWTCGHVCHLSSMSHGLTQDSTPSIFQLSL